jgi:hypothetical protein
MKIVSIKNRDEWWKLLSHLKNIGYKWPGCHIIESDKFMFAENSDYCLFIREKTVSYASMSYAVLYGQPISFNEYMGYENLNLVLIKAIESIYV